MARSFTRRTAALRERHRPLRHPQPGRARDGCDARRHPRPARRRARRAALDQSRLWPQDARRVGIARGAPPDDRSRGDRVRVIGLTTLYLAYKDPRVPWYAKLVAICVVAYAFSPIDLIPDFIPVLGYLDDLILVPLGVALALRLIPNWIGIMAYRMAK
jgi:hypothetical protein